MYLFLCLHLLIFSELLFSMLSSLCRSIASFSVRHRRHRLELWLYDLWVPQISQDMFEVLFTDIVFQTEYGDVLHKSPYAVQKQQNTDQKELRIWTPFTQCLIYWKKQLFPQKFLIIVLWIALKLQWIRYNPDIIVLLPVCRDFEFLNNRYLENSQINSVLSGKETSLRLT